MGDKDMRATAQVSNRMLDRPAAAVRNSKGSGGGDAQTRVAGTLTELRATVTELDPGRAVAECRMFGESLEAGDMVRVPIDPDDRQPGLRNHDCCVVRYRLVNTGTMRRTLT